MCSKLTGPQQQRNESVTPPTLREGFETSPRRTLALAGMSCKGVNARKHSKNLSNRAERQKAGSYRAAQRLTEKEEAAYAVTAR